MKGALRDELDARVVGGSVFAQSSLILSKLDLLISKGEDKIRRCRLESESTSIGEVIDNNISFVVEEDIEGLETDFFCVLKREKE